MSCPCMESLTSTTGLLLLGSERPLVLGLDGTKNVIMPGIILGSPTIIEDTPGQYHHTANAVADHACRAEQDQHIDKWVPHQRTVHRLEHCVIRTAHT